VPGVVPGLLAGSVPRHIWRQSFNAKIPDAVKVPRGGTSCLGTLPDCARDLRLKGKRALLGGESPADVAAVAVNVGRKSANPCLLG